jgi:hypothetical protein
MIKEEDDVSYRQEVAHLVLDIWMSVWSVQLGLDLVDLGVQLVQLVAELLKGIPVNEIR